MKHAPDYWLHEESGALAPIVRAYLAGEELAPEQIAALREYFRQWVYAPAFVGMAVDSLRFFVRSIETRYDIAMWLKLAQRAGVNPL